MIIVRENRLARVTEVSAEEEEWLAEYLTFEDGQAYFKKREPMRCLYSQRAKTFPAGFIPLVRKAHRRDLEPKGSTFRVEDARLRPEPGFDPSVDLGWLHDFQRESVTAIVKKKRGIIWVATGGGKCLGLGTPVLRYDGSVVPVEAVQEGDLLMGPDSRPRRVLTTTRGRGKLFKINPKKGNPWVCNDVHVLSLKHTETGDVVDVSLPAYCAQTPTFRHLHKQFSVGVDFPPGEPLPLDPYFLGAWLGDGRKNLSQGVQISKPDPEIKTLAHEAASWFPGLTVREDLYPPRCPTYRIVNSTRGQANPLLNLLRKVVGEGVTIPHRYLTASRADRAALLAGFLDTDGHLHGSGFEITQKREDYADAICFLARSLGLRALKNAKDLPRYGRYWRIHLSGDMAWLPLRIPRKKAPLRRQKKDATRTGFTVEPIGTGEYAGFQLDGDGRFLLGDFTVTHNTEIAAGLCKSIRCSWLFLTHKKDLYSNAFKRFRKRLRERVGTIAEGRCEIERVTVATFQSLERRLEAKEPAALDLLEHVGGVLTDECHVGGADSFWSLVMKCNAYYRVGLSGTPLARSDNRTMMIFGALGPVVHRVKASVLIDMGILARPHIRMLECEQLTLDQPTWQGAYGAGVVRSKKRNAVVMEAIRRVEKPALVFFKEIKHGKALLQLAQDKFVGTTFECVDGKNSLAEREAAVERLTRRDTDVLFCSNIFDAGIDIPAVNGGVNASGGKSVIGVIQKLGRAMRSDGGRKTDFDWYDILDIGNPWLEKHARRRIKAYKGEGHEVTFEGASGPLFDDLVEEEEEKDPW